MSDAMTKPRVAVIVGSNRGDSLNGRLARALVALGTDKLDAKFVRIDDLPLYNQEHESPSPPAVTRFKNDIAAADGVLIVTPEHNRPIPAVLKNAIDWARVRTGKTCGRTNPASSQAPPRAQSPRRWCTSICVR